MSTHLIPSIGNIMPTLRDNSVGNIVPTLDSMLSSKSLRTLTLAFELVGSNYLMTKNAGDKLRTETETRDQQIEQLETKSHRTKTDIDTKLHKLQQMLNQTTTVLKHNNTDVRTQIKQMNEQIARLENESAELHHKVKQLDQQFLTQRSQLDEQFTQLKPNTKKAIDPAQIPTNKATHYKATYNTYQTTDYDKTRKL